MTDLNRIPIIGESAPSGAIKMATTCGCGTALEGRVEVLDVVAPPGAGYVLDCSNCGAVWAIGISLEVTSILLQKPAPPENGKTT